MGRGSETDQRNPLCSPLSPTSETSSCGRTIIYDSAIKTHNGAEKASIGGYAGAPVSTNYSESRCCKWGRRAVAPCSERTTCRRFLPRVRLDQRIPGTTTRMAVVRRPARRCTRAKAGHSGRKCSGGRPSWRRLQHGSGAMDQPHSGKVSMYRVSTSRTVIFRLAAYVLSFVRRSSRISKLTRTKLLLSASSVRVR